MSKMLVRMTRGAFVFLFLAGGVQAVGCGSGESGSSPECAMEVPSSFDSVEELDIGESPDGGLAMGHWNISFSENGSYVWHVQDTLVSGAYRCSGDEIRAEDEPSSLLFSSPLGIYDAEAGTLLWDDVLYRKSVGQTCGGFAGLTCDRGQICDMSENSVCGVDLEGVCAIPADICTREFDPVCGCNDITYDNDCLRRSEGVALQYRGECSGG